VDLTGASQPGARREEVVETIRQACEDTGFLVVTGHGVSDNVIRGIEAVSREFFSLPYEEKMRLSAGLEFFEGIRQ
tara:strand:+ start:358 stop:585 length:228 start_codon:yes stop_codon:yes gene_type:complete